MPQPGIQVTDDRGAAPSARPVIGDQPRGGVCVTAHALPKSAWLERHRNEDLRYDNIGLQDVNVRTYVPVAFATAQQDAIGTHQCHLLPKMVRDVLVLVRNDDQWEARQHPHELHCRHARSTPLGLTPRRVAQERDGNQCSQILSVNKDVEIPKRGSRAACQLASPSPLVNAGENRWLNRRASMHTG